MTTYKDRKVITIGMVNEITGLSVRRIRYYEERGLIFPERTDKGTRKYSFNDIETLVKIANMREEGVQTSEIKSEMHSEKRKKKFPKNILKGQLSAQFNRHK